jgi:CBS domain containing-hemolysin-like protein
MSGANWVVLAVVIFLFLFSIYLAMAETAFVRMSRIRALSLAEEGSKPAAKLVKLLERPEQTLNVVLLLVLVSQLTSATLLGSLLEGIAGPVALVIGIILQIVLFFVVGEVAPKTYAVQHTDRAALRVSGFLHLVTNFPPLRVLSSALIGLANAILPGKGLKQGPFVTEGEIRAMVDEAADTESIETEERKLIHSIFQFGDMVVREAMQPRTDMIAIGADQTIEEAIEEAIGGGYSRIPVFGDTTDDIIGIVYLKDLVARARAGEGDRAVCDAARPAEFVPEQKKVSELLREMQAQQFHMAIVVDEHGGTAGIATIEDVVEELLGEIQDEYDQEETPGFVAAGERTFLLEGGFRLDDIEEQFGLSFPRDEAETIAGHLMLRFGRIPRKGERWKGRSAEFIVEDATPTAIRSVRMILPPPPATPPPA